jgi:hypothetical protein
MKRVNAIIHHQEKKMQQMKEWHTFSPKVDNSYLLYTDIFYRVVNEI